MTSPTEPPPPEPTSTGPGPVPDGRTARGERTRAALLRATTDLVRDVGYAQATTRAVSAKAGVAEGTLYRHFPDKTSLLLAAVMEQAAPALVWMSALPAKAGERTVAENLIESLTGLATLRETMLPLELALLTDPELAHHTRTALPPDQDPAALLAAYLHAEQRLGRIRNDVLAPTVAAVLLAALFGLAAAPPEASAVIGEVTILDVITLVLRGAAPPES